jgi:exodeoxyribonuclease VII small subunit
MAPETSGGAGGPELNGGGVSDLTYSAASEELDAIIGEFEAGVVDVDLLVERLERATAIVDELDRRLRRTRMQVEELVPRLERIGRPAESGTTEDEGLDGDEILEEVYLEENEAAVEYEYEDEDEGASSTGAPDGEAPPGLF